MGLLRPINSGLKGCKVDWKNIFLRYSSKIQPVKRASLFEFNSGSILWRTIDTGAVKYILNSNKIHLNDLTYVKKIIR